MHMEVVVKVGLDELVNEASDCRALVIGVTSVLVLDVGLPHICRAELGLGLALEVRLLDLDAHCSDDALTDVLRVEVLLGECLEELLECL